MKALKQVLKKYPHEIFLFATWGVFFTVLFARMVEIRPDGLYVGHENVWSDWASIHLGLTNIFATKPPKLWFAYHPVFADGKLTYAFLTNLISALFVRAGLSTPMAMILPSIALSIALIFGFFRLFTILLKSRNQALCSVFVFFFSAGLGFFTQLQKFWSDHDPSHLFLIEKQLSDQTQYQWYAGNFIVGHLLPQRAFLLGMTLAVWALIGLFKRERRTLVLSGLAMGLLPIAHMHSLMAMSIALLPFGLYWLRKDWRLPLYFVIPGALLAVALYFAFIAGGIQDKNFMSIQPWFGISSFWTWLGFWAQAWGVLIPLAAGGLYLAYKKKLENEKLLFFFGFFILFIAANFVQFQPTRWDNSKMLLWCYFGFSPLAVYALFMLWNETPMLKPVAILFALLLTYTGFLETTDLLRAQKHTFRLLTTDELKISEEIREKTDPLARFASAFRHNHPIATWAARPVLLGYWFWAFNFGFDFKEVQKDVPEIYKGGPRTEELLRKHRVSYVYLGPLERKDFHPNEAYFEKKFPLAFASPNGGEKVFDSRFLLKTH